MERPMKREKPNRETVKKPGDPLLKTIAATDQRAYLEALLEVGMRDRALKLARERTGAPGINRIALRKWREDARFAEIEAELHGLYWDEFAQKGVDAVLGGGRIPGGSANLLMQQLNRARPDEYLPAIVQQIHQTVSYRVEGDFREPEEKVKTSDG